MTIFQILAIIDDFFQLSCILFVDIFLDYHANFLWGKMDSQKLPKDGLF